MSRIYQAPKMTVSPAVSHSNINTIKAEVKPVQSTSESPSGPSSNAPSIDNKNVSNQNNTKSSELDKMAQENLTKLIARLESVTSRLESLSQSGSPAVSNGKPEVKTNGIVADDTESLPTITAFDSILNNNLNSLVQLSTKIGNDAKSILDLVQKAFQFERSFLVEAARCTQPSQDVLTKFFQQFSKYIEEVSSFREKNRKSDLFNHLSAISESIGALGWIAVQPTPVPYIKEMIDSAQFYTNRVLKDYKEKDANHVNWAKQWLELLNELQAYVKQYHTTGVVWNSSKKSQTFDIGKLGSDKTVPAAPAAPSGAPLPPPPPLPDFKELLADDPKSQTNSQMALFAEINKGSSITSNLKKVTDDQKTHKNPNLRANNIVPASAATSTAPKTSVSAKPPVAKPPVLELEDKKWKVEYQNNRTDLVIDQTDLKHTVYIYQCKESTITIKGKVNSILVDSCNRVGVLFDDVLSTVEFINCKNVQMQVVGRVPTVTIEKTDGCQVYLSKNSLETEIVSSKSSAMNILIPNATEDDYTEHPVPEQFKTTIDIKSKKLVTNATESV